MITAVFKLSRHVILPHAPLAENYLIQVLLMGIPVLLLSGMYFRFIEQPCMRSDWPSRLWSSFADRFRPGVRGLHTNQLGASSPAGERTAVT